MPYRRLPNTDAARIKALETALLRANEVSQNELAISQKTLQKVRFFVPVFKQSMIFHKETLTQQVTKNSNYTALFKKTKLYISHFIQVLNLAVIREELPQNALSFYELPSDGKVPPLQTEHDLLKWGKILIDGEARRTAQGGVAMSNPRIAMVKVKYEQFVDAQKNQKFLQSATSRASDKTASIRPEADELILTLWNEIEKHFESLPADAKRRSSREYGVVYVQRKNEDIFV